jgi:protein AATF/BFR2
LTNERDEEIYNDFDFYQALLKDFLATNDSTGLTSGPTENGGEEDIYLEGADIGMTQKFLE